jgi:hypothetical protein
MLVAVMSRAADFAILQNGFEIRHEQREVVGANTRLYLTTDPTAGFVDVPTAQIIRYEHDDSVKPPKSIATLQSKPLDIKSVVDEASKTHSIDPDLIASVIHAESRFNPRALSPKGAQGLMQLMPGTASKLGVTNAFDPHANVDGGTRYLRELLLRYNDDLIKALAAYNAGPQRVDQYHGVPPYRETRLYVANIIRDFNQKKLAAQKANAPPAYVTAAKKGAPAKAVARKQHVALTSKKVSHASAVGAAN